MGDTRHAIPWSAMTMDTDEKRFASTFWPTASRTTQASTKTTGLRWRTPRGRRCMNTVIASRIGQRKRAAWTIPASVSERMEERPATHPSVPPSGICGARG